MPEHGVAAGIAREVVSRPAEHEAAAPDCPYVGLVPFSAADEPRFFGREKERKIVVTNLKASRLTLLYGSSGVGKSSLLRAGVVHDLQQQSLQNLADLGTPKFVVVYFNSWRDNPVQALSMAVREAAEPLLQGQSLPAIAPEEHLDHFLEACSAKLNATLLILADQFEEYFLYHPKGGGPESFDAELSQAINHAGLRANFLISMREDMLAQLDRLKGRIPNILGNYLRIEHLDRGAARAAIEKPLEWYNRQPAAKGRKFTIEPTLTESVLQQVATGQVVLGDAGCGTVSADATDAGKARIETPFLQLVLTQLWEEEQRAGSTVMRLTTLNDNLGGAAQIINKHVENAMADLTADEQQTAAGIFHYLVTPSGVKIAQTLGDLAALANVSQERLAPLLDKLSRKSRVLRSVESAPDRPGDRRYQLFHDVLAPAVLSWRARYIRAAEAEERARQLQQQAEKEASAKRMRRLSVGLMVFCALGVFAALIAWKETAKAREQAQINISQALDAAATSNLQQDPQLSLLLALQSASVLKELRKPLSVSSRVALSAALEASRQIHIFRPDHEGAKLLDASVSPNGTRVVAGADDGTAAVWDAASHKKLFDLKPHEAGVFAAIFSPEGRYIATSSFDGITRLYSSTGELLGSTPKEQGMTPVAAAFMAHDVALVVASSSATRSVVDFWIPSSGGLDKIKSISLPLPAGQRLETLAFTLDGRRLAFGLTGGIAAIAEINTQKVLVLQSHFGKVQAVAFSADGERLATASNDGSAIIWDASSGKQLTVLRGHSNTVFRVVFDPNNSSRVATASADDTARVWNADTGKTLFELLGHKNVVNSVAFSPDGKEIITASWDGSAILWEASSFHESPAMSVAFSHNRLASASQDGTVKIWNTATIPLHSMITLPKTPAKTDSLWSVAFSPDGERVAAAGVNGWARVFDSSGGELFRLSGLVKDVNSIAFGPDGKRLVTAQSDGAVRIWDANSGAYLFGFIGGDDQVSSAIFSPKGDRLATSSADGTVRLWDASGKAWPAADDKQFIKRFKDQVLGLAFSPQGTHLAACTLDGTVMVFDLVSGQDFKLDGHRMAVGAVAFDPAGKRLATASWDRTARVWDLASHRELFLFTHPLGVESVAFSADGKSLATASDDGVVRLYPLDDDELLELARSRITRTLTTEECRQFLHTDQCPAAK